MKTAKDLAYKAFRLNYQPTPTNDIQMAEMKERFENWWLLNFWDNEHRDHFKSELSVFIEGKRYIQAE